MPEPVTTKASDLNLGVLPELIKTCELHGLVELETTIADALKLVTKEKTRRAQLQIDEIEADAMRKKEEVARLLGVQASDLGVVEESKPRRRKRSPAKPKYQNPDDSESTWSGRGRKPKWVEKHLAAGKTLDDLAISP